MKLLDIYGRGFTVYLPFLFNPVMNSAGEISEISSHIIEIRCHITVEGSDDIKQGEMRSLGKCVLARTGIDRTAGEEAFFGM